MNECWYAFALALLSRDYLTPEKAFQRLNKGIPKKRAWCDARHKDIIPQDIADMIQMKKTMTYKEVGKIYGMKADAVYTRIRRYKEII